MKLLRRQSNGNPVAGREHIVAREHRTKLLTEYRSENICLRTDLLDQADDHIDAGC